MLSVSMPSLKRIKKNLSQITAKIAIFFILIIIFMFLFAFIGMRAENMTRTWGERERMTCKIQQKTMLTGR